jgi:hypothetical protein
MAKNKLKYLAKIPFIIVSMPVSTNEACFAAAAADVVGVYV